MSHAPVMKLNIMGGAPIWMNHLAYGKVWTHLRRGLDPKMDYLINSKKCTSYASMMKLNVMGKPLYG